MHCSCEDGPQHACDTQNKRTGPCTDIYVHGYVHTLHVTCMRLAVLRLHAVMHIHDQMLDSSHHMQARWLHSQRLPPQFSCIRIGLGVGFTCKLSIQLTLVLVHIYTAYNSVRCGISSTKYLFTKPQDLWFNYSGCRGKDNVNHIIWLMATITRLKKIYAEIKPYRQEKT